MVKSIQEYYDHRKQLIEEQIHWRKQEDLEAISTACGDAWCFEACAGSFWFYRFTEKNRITYYTSSNLFPAFEKTVTPRIDGGKHGSIS